MKIYDVEYLMHSELTDEDMHNLIDNHSLEWSLLKHMLYLAGHSLSNKELKKLVGSSNTWMESIEWNKRQSDIFHSILTKVYMNIYQWKEQRARSQADWFMIYFSPKAFKIS